MHVSLIGVADFGAQFPDVSPRRLLPHEMSYQVLSLSHLNRLRHSSCKPESETLLNVEPRHVKRKTFTKSESKLDPINDTIYILISYFSLSFACYLHLL